MVVPPRVRLLRPHFGDVAVPVCGRHAAIHHEVTARDEAAIWPHEQRADGTDFIGRPGSLGDRPFNHAAVAGTPRSRQFVLGERVMTILGLIVLIRAPRLPQCTASAITRNEFARFES
jgi:hypothetical protein